MWQPASIFVVGILAVGSTSRAGACENAVLLEADALVKLGAKAEAALAAGEYGKVTRLLEDKDLEHPADYAAGELERPDGKQRLSHKPDQALVRRLALVYATAQLRSGYRGLALPTLQTLLASVAGKDDEALLLRARIAEAQSYKKATLAEAATVLEDLATRDLVPDAPTWLALARVRRAKGDAAGTTVAVEKCQATAHKGESCKL